MTLPKGRIPNETFQYCITESGGSIDPFLDENNSKSWSVKLGYYGFSATTNRELLEQFCYFIANLPNPTPSQSEVES